MHDEIWRDALLDRHFSYAPGLEAIDAFKYSCPHPSIQSLECWRMLFLPQTKFVQLDPMSYEICRRVTTPERRCQNRLPGVVHELASPAIYHMKPPNDVGLTGTTICAKTSVTFIRERSGIVDIVDCQPRRGERVGGNESCTGEEGFQAVQAKWYVLMVVPV
jgi:hypothetical protein